MNINKMTENFKNDIFNIINSYNKLPCSIIYYILKDIIRDIETVYYQSLQQKQQQGEEDK